MDVQIFHELNRHLMEDEKPSSYFIKKEEEGFFLRQYPLTQLEVLKRTEQNPVYHPEGNVWNHTLLVVDNAARLKNQSGEPQVFMWAALLHDIGKPLTTRLRKGRITAYNHDIEGEKLSAEFLQCFHQDKKFIHRVSKMVRWHMQILMVTKDLPFADIRKMVREVPLYEIALLGMCDRMGRGEVTKKMFEDEKRKMQQFIEKCLPYVDE